MRFTNIILSPLNFLNEQKNVFAIAMHYLQFLALWTIPEPFGNRSGWRKESISQPFAGMDPGRNGRQQSLL